MIDDWFSAIKLPLTWQQFWQLPRNPAYKYEYFDGHAWLSPWPKSHHAVLDLQTFTRPIAEMGDPEKSKGVLPGDVDITAEGRATKRHGWEEIRAVP